MAFTLVFTELFLKKLKQLDRSVAIELEKKVDRLAENPVSPANRMQYSDNFFRVYVRNFRIVYKVEGNRVILFDILKRKEGYSKFGGS